MTHIEAKLTPNLGLRKPNTDDLVNLSNDFNSNWDAIDVQIGPFNLTWTSWSPVWSSASSPQPAIGNGTFTSSYLRVGELIVVKYRLEAGSTTTFGTGAWRFDDPFDLEVFSGAILCRDVSGSLYFPGTINSLQAGLILNLCTTTGVVTPTSPFTWADGDILYATITGEVE